MFKLHFGVYKMRYYDIYTAIKMRQLHPIIP